MKHHPTPAELALLSGGDLPFYNRWRIQFHLRGCAQCAAELARLQETRTWLAETGGMLPPGLDWNSLAAEMKANIHLGLEAGALAGAARPMARPALAPASWQWAAVSAALGLVLFSGWFLSKPRDFYQRVQPSFASATLDGIGVSNQGATLTLLAPATAVASTAEAGEGVQARYVDADSGQVTIHHVFAE